MAPRKVSDTEPRRSGRIAALPAAPAPAEAPKPKAAKAKATKKRSAEDVDDAKEGETSATKKVRTAYFFFSCTQVALLIEPFFSTRQKLRRKRRRKAMLLLCQKLNLVAVCPASLSRTRRAKTFRWQIWPLRKELSCSSFPKLIRVRRSSLWRIDVLTLVFVSAGCTNQACGFRDIYPDFTSLNFDVYCLSADTPTAQTKWQTKVDSYLFVQVSTC